ncbi:DUF5004 domain-containing protein [Pleomorphovibrio marinus]|uniref:DUF5004 domain-containing protein n=1 Tax=Pleomorphovibrio marinus TaxID=2164132 RepID=UPI001E50438E|nr:DUF5004 domain-containing protein [Pleomorphovibrio marinus]
MNKKVLLLVLSILPLIISCGSDDDGPQLSPEQEARQQLAGEQGSLTWAIAGGGSVSKDGVSQTGDFANFEITFLNNTGGQNYTTANGGNLFNANGSWSVTGENLDRLLLTGNQPASGREIAFTRNQESLRLEFTVAPPSNARVSALAGFYVIELRIKN